MTDKFEELKAAALGANLHGWTGIEDSLNADGYSRAMTRFIQHCRPSEILELLAVREAQSVPVTAEDITEIMAQEWGEWCSDTGHFPDDFEWRGGHGILSFEPSRWSLRVAERILKLTTPPAPAVPNEVGRLLSILDRHTVELGWGEKPITLAELVVARDGNEELDACRAAMLKNEN